MAELYDLDNARSDEQRERMRQLEQDGICLFCPEYLMNGGQEILWTKGIWTAISNAYPYTGAKYHILLIPDEHVSDVTDLSGQAWSELKRALEVMSYLYGKQGYTVGVRNGDTRTTGGTVKHLHIHFIVGDPDGPPVMMKVSKGKKPW